MQKPAVLAVLLLAACHDGSATPGADLGHGADMAHGPTGDPISAPSETWTWVPFADAHCADGTTTGIGINTTTRSTRLLIYLEGGGACWDAQTCAGSGAANFKTGYGEAQFTAEASNTSYLARPDGFFDRASSSNPFKDYSYVYVPYCTGDVHAGNHVATYGTQTAMHVGYANMTAYLARLAATFPHADRVVLSGSSAGGFGAIYNWDNAQAAFGATRVDVVDDSGTFMPADIRNKGNGSEIAQATNWGLLSTLPQDCSDCAAGFDNLYGYYATKYADHRAALLSYVADSTLPGFAGITQAEFTTGLYEVIAAQMDPHPGFGYFLVAGSGHVLFLNPAVETTGIALNVWLGQMETDDPAWSKRKP